MLLVWPTVPTADLGSPKSSTWTATTHPSIKEAALRAASTKGGGRLRRPPPFVDSFMDGCVVAVQVEDFGLPKSAVGTAGQTSKICLILTLDFQAVQVEVWPMFRTMFRTMVSHWHQAANLGASLENAFTHWFRTG